MSVAKVRAEIETQGRAVYCVYEVEKIHNGKNGSDKRILAVTDSFICFKGGKKDWTFYWIDLESMEIQGEKIILDFDKTEESRFQFICDKSSLPVIKASIGCVVQRVLTKHEQRSLKISDFTDLEYKYTPNSIMARFFCYIMKFKLERTLRDIKDSIFILGNIFSSRFPYIYIDNRISGIMQALLGALYRCSYLQSLEFVQQMTCDVFSMLSHVVGNRFPASHILFTGPVSRTFPSFIDAIKNAVSCKLEGLTFRDSNFDEATLDKLGELDQNCDISSISLQGAINPEILPTIYDKFFVSPLMSQIKMVCFDGNQGIDFGKCFTILKSATCFSFYACNIDIYEVFNSLISQGYDRNIQMLNLGRNFCSKPIEIDNESKKLPKTLLRIDVDSCKWEPDTFPTFIFSILSQPLEFGIHLNLSYTNFENNEEWKKIDKTLKRIKNSNLAQLDWSGNVIGDNFASFISKQKRLINLYVCNCYNSSNIEALYALGDSISSLDNLLTYSMENTPQYENKIGENISQFIDKLKNKNLQNINISMNNIGSKGLDSLYNIISESESIEVVSFKGTGLFNIDEIITFTSKLLQAGKKLYIDYPYPDIEVGNQNGDGKDKVDTLRDNLWKLMPDEIYPSENDVFEDPLKETPIEYKWDIIQTYPLFITDEINDILEEGHFYDEKEPTGNTENNKTQNSDSSDDDSNSDSDSSDESSSDDIKIKKPAKKTKTKTTILDSSDDSDDDIKHKTKAKKNNKKKNILIDSSDDDSDSDADTFIPKIAKKKQNGKNKKTALSDDSEDDDRYSFNHKSKKGRNVLTSNISSSSNDDNNKTSKKKKAIISSDSDESSDDANNHKKKTQKGKKPWEIESSSDDSDDEEQIPKKKKQQKSPKKKHQESSDSDNSDNLLLKKKKKKAKQQSDDSDDDDIGKFKISKRPPKKGRQNSDDDDDEIRYVPLKNRKNRKISSSDSEDERIPPQKQQNKKPVWKFPIETVDEVDDSQVVKDLQIRYSLKNLCATVFGQ